jgi:hypothetical protein
MGPPDRSQPKSSGRGRLLAAGLNLVVAAIILWNTVYLSRAVDQIRAEGYDLPDNLRALIARLGWEHISLDRRLRLAVALERSKPIPTATRNRLTLPSGGLA